jgi:Protein of unknown function (DUF3352)
MSRLVLVLAVAALVLPVTGCGESSGQGGAAGASIAPAGTVAFVSLDTSVDSSNWDSARALLARFPDGDRAVAWVTRQLGAQGIDFERDVKPALGPETDIVEFKVSGSGRFVGLTQPDDRAKLDALLTKGEHPLVSRDIDGWVAFADSAEILNEFQTLRNQGTLDAVDAYNQVIDQVPGDGLLQAYVAPSALARTPLAHVFGQDAPSLAVSLKPEHDGIHVEGAASPASGDLFSDEFKAELPAELPGGVYLYSGTSDLDAQLGALRDALGEAAPNFDRDLARAEAELGVSLDEDVFPLFSSESAFYVRPGFPIPEVTLVTQVDDEQGAMRTMDKIANALTEYYPGARLDSYETAGVQAKRLSVNRFLSVYYGALDGKLVITTSQQGIADVRSGDDRLADDQAFKDATTAAGMPDETTGFVYVDLAKAVPALLGLAQVGGVHAPDLVRANTAPLHSLVLYGTRDGDIAKFQGVLGIQ